MLARIIAGVLAGSLIAGAAEAASPRFGTREGDLGCAGLLAVAYEGAKASAKPQEQVLSATIAAYGVYIGRLSATSGPITRQAMGQVVDKMSNEERNAFGRACLARAGELLKAPFAGAQPSARPRPGT
ncbi:MULTISPECIES: hypothetical protein [Phenylobacterium]|uniref:ABC-type transporter lipoprotein component MlaA n=1 Tax=Phenylobacterium koreense TaxID=266125 RepID=A0ABV2EGB5_9CAUL